LGAEIEAKTYFVLRVKYPLFEFVSDET